MVSPEDDQLLDAARDAQGFAYAPYSKYPVGAAVRTESGEVFTGCNVESASFSLTCCAERVAVFKAVSEGHKKIVACAIVTDETVPAAPCGACRQVLHEFGSDMTILLSDGADTCREMTLSDLLPEGFNPDQVLSRQR